MNSPAPRVTFKYKRIAEDEWEIEAHYPGAEIRYIKPMTLGNMRANGVRSLAVHRVEAVQRRLRDWIRVKRARARVW